MGIEPENVCVKEGEGGRESGRVKQILRVGYKRTYYYTSHTIAQKRMHSTT